MESDDDYQSFSPPVSPSPTLHKLKRLKKKSTKIPSPDPLPLKSASLIPLPLVDFAQLEALESTKNPPYSDYDSNSADYDYNDQSQSQLQSDSGNDGDEVVFDKKTKRGLDFGDGEEDLSEKTEALGGFDGAIDDDDDDDDEKKKFKSVLSIPDVDFEELEALEGSKRAEFDGSDEALKEDLEADKLISRVPELDEAVVDGDLGGIEGMKEDFRVEKSERKRSSDGGLGEKEKKKKKKVKGVSDETKQNLSNKRREEKERKSQLQQLHAESQRLLRETRGAGFKPVSVVQKPISSILEKIRKRKMEVSRKISSLNKIVSFAEDNEAVVEVMMDLDSVKVSTEGGTIDKLAEGVQEEANSVANPDHIDSSLKSNTVINSDDIDSSLDAFNYKAKESGTQSSHENVTSQMALDEVVTPTFRVPVDDTQDLFGDSQMSELNDNVPKDQDNSPLEEVLAPSLLTMNLKFDSAPPDDDSFSDEEENDKENLYPLVHESGDECSSPKGDPVKAFVDDEAEEEDDSDHDLFRFQENEEDEDNEDSDELNDLIVTGYEEKAIDSERRNELHQKWLEQQDAAGTDNLMQRLKCGSKGRDTILLSADAESDEDEEGSSENEEEIGMVPTKTARINTKKAKQMITQMFADNEDAFLSSDDEETEKMLVKQRLLDKVADKATLVSPAEDEKSREVFGLIKKLNDVPVTKKKPKASTFFDTLLTGRNSSSSSKSSFLGRMSSHSLPSSNKQRSSVARSFIFGRDDSNSRSSVTISEDSSDAVSIENRPTRNVTAKYSGSLAKSMTQSTQIVTETTSGMSLFEILKRSSMQSNSCNQDTMVGLTQTVFSAFKIPKRPIKMEGRTKY